MVQAAIPDVEGLETPEPSDTGPRDQPDTEAIASLVAAFADSYQERLGLKQRLFSEADFFAIKTVADAELFVKKLQLLDHFANIDGRRKYAVWLFGLILGWLFLVLFTLCASGVKVEMPSYLCGYTPMVSEFNLTDAVLLALIGSTTVNVIGLLYVVVRYLFPRRDGDKTSSPEGEVPSRPIH